MQPAADAFRTALSHVQFRMPIFPVISNVTAQAVADPEQIRELLVRQIVSPVRWDASMRHLASLGASDYAEFPPARVLAGLLRRIDAALPKAATLDSPKDFEKLPKNSP
jgi:[acyl-carrier-protein] S-malonyltransferase